MAQLSEKRLFLLDMDGTLYLNALTGEGVHVVTVNDYLARRFRN